MLRSMITMIGLTLAVLAQAALAQQPAPSVWVENVVVPEGTPSVNVEVSFMATPAQQATQFEIHYDTTFLTADISSTCPMPASMGCSEGVPGTIIFASGFFGGGGLPNFVGDIVFNLAPMTPIGTYPLVIMNELHLEGGVGIPSAGSQNGSIEVQDVPAPVFQLNHDGGGAGNTIDFGTDDLPGPAMFTVNASVENIGNDPMNNLDGSCGLTNTAGGVFTISPDPVPFDLPPGATAPFTMDCATDVPGTYNGELTCTHDGASSPDVFALVCTELPTPTYGDSFSPPLTMMGTQGNADPGVSHVIDNDLGEAGSTLTGTCGLSGDPQISISGSAAFSVLQGATDTVDLTCSAAAQGLYTSTLTCTPDPSASNAMPFMYPVSCDIGPPDPGTWGSTPPSGGNVDLTPAGPVVEGTDLTNAGQLLVRNAGDPGDADLTYSCDIIAGSPEITQNPSPSAGTLVAGDPDTVINYSCDTTNDGSFLANVQCGWTNSVEGLMGTEDYTVTCDVRDPFIDVVETPPSGTPQSAQDLMPGDSTTFSFLFEEIVNEGGDGSVDTCSLTGDASFAITAPGSFPQPVPSGGSLQVDVEWNDPGAGDTFTSTLNCTVTDNPDGGEPDVTDVSWPLEVTVIGRNATFLVTKDFDDDNPAGVFVSLECNTGLPLQQFAIIHDPDAGFNLEPGDFTFVEFVVVDFEPGTMDCDIEEVVPVGYEGSYFADFGDDGIAASVFDDEFGCHYEGIESADFICEITNTLQPVDVIVNKEWIDENPQFQLPTWVDVTLFCNVPINLVLGAEQTSSDIYSSSQFVQPGFPGLWQVFPHWDGSTFCFATEEDEAGVIQDESDCENIPLAPGQGGECTLVNTRLFAGIPTLSQYGLILMALLMLGVGLVAFRRYG